MSELQNPAPDESSGSSLPSRTGQHASLLERFLARLVDNVLVGLVAGGAILLGSRVAERHESWVLLVIVMRALTAVVALGYFALMESSRGQTVGKMLVNLETRGPGGGRPTLEQAVRRNLFYAIGLLSWIPLLGLLADLALLVAVVMIAVTISSSPTRQGWHDTFAGGTYVVRVR